MNQNCHNNGFCCNLQEDFRNRLCKACFRLSLKPKQELLFDHSTKQVAIINEGVVISLFLLEDGRQKSAELLKAGDLLGAYSLFQENNSQTGYMLSLTNVGLCMFPAEVFETFFQQSPEFSKTVLRSLSDRFHKSLNHLLQMQISNSEDKIRYVLDFLKEAGIDPSYLTHEDLALLSDLNRVTVTRAIKVINQLHKQ
ncbi:Crp/Fnr family transcriptional regulator [Dehalobacter sp. DCM]|uniref:Crp/Fnr family transcriptional regulator n=1 Tax=Dehalobacter sp. DCM TaxID=2907827 RepID=UPI003081DDA4|nr:Crp/Fnr family transcriptional regulator [Dehalobacter sp. DCM]